jgi:hypothetical protein
VKSKEFAVASATLTLVTLTLALSLVGQVMPASQTSRTLSNAGAVMAIGVGVYWDNACTNVTSSIYWGTLEPGSNKNITCYVRNEGNSPSALSMYTSGWSPQNASNYIDFSWDYAGEFLNPDEAVQVTFTLSVSPSIDGITSFGFDITIVGSS